LEVGSFDVDLDKERLSVVRDELPGSDAGDPQFLPFPGLLIDVRFERRPAVFLETAIKGELSRLPQDSGVHYFDLAGADLALESLRALSGKQGIGLDPDHAVPEVEIVRSIVAIIEANIEDEFRYRAQYRAFALQLILLASYLPTQNLPKGNLDWRSHEAAKR
jgi:hypothetical protein